MVSSVCMAKSVKIKLETLHSQDCCLFRIVVKICAVYRAFECIKNEVVFF